MESGEEAALMAIREVEEDPSVEDMSLFISSLLRRDTEIVLLVSMLETLWRADGGLLAEAPRRRCSAGMLMSA